MISRTQKLSVFLTTMSLALWHMQYNHTPEFVKRQEYNNIE